MVLLMMMRMMTTAQVAVVLAGVGSAVARCTGPGPGSAVQWAAGQCLLLPVLKGLLWMLQVGCLYGHT